MVTSHRVSTSQKCSSNLQRNSELSCLTWAGSDWTHDHKNLTALHQQKLQRIGWSNGLSKCSTHSIFHRKFMLQVTPLVATLPRSLQVLDQSVSSPSSWYHLEGQSHTMRRLMSHTSSDVQMTSHRDSSQKKRLMNSSAGARTIETFSKRKRQGFRALSSTTASANHAGLEFVKSVRLNSPMQWSITVMKWFKRQA